MALRRLLAVSCLALGLPAALQPKPRVAPVARGTLRRAEKAVWSQMEEAAHWQDKCCSAQKGWAFKAEMLTGNIAKS